MPEWPRSVAMPMPTTMPSLVLLAILLVWTRPQLAEAGSLTSGVTATLPSVDADASAAAAASAADVAPSPQDSNTSPGDLARRDPAIQTSPPVPAASLVRKEAGAGTAAAADAATATATSATEAGEKSEGIIWIPGRRGPRGYPGDRGQIGPRGAPGQDGIQGSRGWPGADGGTGPAGHPGAKGYTGTPGKKGKQGKKGHRGKRGPLGFIGVPGIPGPVGPPGVMGDLGPEGQAGPPGLPGQQGPKGEMGEQGDPGPIGDPGEKGYPGVTGPPGDKGEDGKAVHVQNCVWGRWSDWADCSRSCGIGRKRRERNVKIAPTGGGLNCFGKFHEWESCQKAPCPGDYDDSLVAMSNQRQLFHTHPQWKADAYAPGLLFQLLVICGLAAALSAPAAVIYWYREQRQAAKAAAEAEADGI